MITYTFRIDRNDGNDLQNLYFLPYNAFSDTIKLNEELDSGFITIVNNTNEIYPIFSYLEFSFTDGITIETKRYYIGRDEVKRISKDSEKYEHNIELIELTKKLEKYLCETICFTQPQNANEKYYYLSDCIERIMRIIPVDLDDTTNPWNYGTLDRQDDNKYSNLPITDYRPLKTMSATLSNALYNIVAPQFVFQDLTLREMLNGILKYINAIAKVDTTVVNARQIIGADFYNMLKKVVSQFNNDTYNADLNVEDYATNTDTFTQNQINESDINGSSIVYPSLSSYDNLKSNNDNYSITDSNCGILTSFPIYAVQKVEIPMKITMRYILSGEQVEFDIYVSVDVSYFIVENEIFNNLSLKGSGTHYTFNNNLPLYKDNTLPYSKGGNFINFSNSVKGFIFTNVAFNKAITLASLQQIANNNLAPNLQPYSFDGEVSINGVSTVGTFSGFSYQNSFWSGNVSIVIPFDYEDIIYRITYTPQVNSRITTQRENTENINMVSSNISNQQERLVSFENFSNSLWSISQRTGTLAKELSCRHYAISDLLNVGDYTQDREVITTAEYIYFNDFIIGKYALSKDYNRINEFIGLNAQIRQYQMPNDKQSYLRIIKMQNVCEVDFSLYNDLISTNNFPFITLKGLNTFLKTFFPSDVDLRNYKKINSTLYGSDSVMADYWKNDIEENSATQYDKLLLSTACNGGGNCLNFDFGFDDNLSALPLRYYDATETKLLKRYIAYAYPKGSFMGFLRNANFKLIDQTYGELFYSNIFPLTDDDTNNIYTCFDIPDMLILKDPSEILRFNFQMPIISKSQNIIIGRYLSIDNALIKNTSDENLYVFLSRNEYSLYDNLKVKETSLQPYDTLDNVVVIKGSHIGTANSACSVYIHFNADFISTQESGSIKTIIIANQSGTKMYLALRKINGKFFNNSTNILHFNFLRRRRNVVYNY